MTENQTEVAHSLGRLEAGIEGIHQRLDRLNGSVARHEQRINAIERWMWRCVGGGATLALIWKAVEK